MVFRREKGLCYNCDEKWSSSHRCKGCILLFIVDPEEPNTTPESTPLKPTNPATDLYTSPNPPHISLHALSGLSVLENFRIYGSINGVHLTVLIDCRGTQNFIQLRMAKGTSQLQILHLCVSWLAIAPSWTVANSVSPPLCFSRPTCSQCLSTAFPSVALMSF